MYHIPCIGYHEALLHALSLSRCLVLAKWGRLDCIARLGHYEDLTAALALDQGTYDPPRLGGSLRL